MSNSKTGRSSAPISSFSAALPERPSLEHLKKQAKDLLRAARAGEASAIARFAAVSRDTKTPRDVVRALTLASAQHSVALEYGFISWSSLKDEVQLRRAQLLRSEGLPEERGLRLELLRAAIVEHDTEAVRVLLELDSSLALGNSEIHPLGVALEADLPSMVDLLADAGAPLEPSSPYPHTAFSWAITLGALRGAQRLAERGVQVDLWCAAGLGNVERVRCFFDAEGKPVPGASRHGATRYDADSKVLPKPPSDPIELISDALYIACRNGQLDVARVLLEHGADPGLEGFFAAPALHWAAFSGNAALVQLLLAHGANPEQPGGPWRCKYRQFAVRTPIEWSWLRALQNAVGGDPSLVHERDATWGPPLHAAAAKGLDEYVRLLIDCGADVHALDASGRTALDCAKLADDSEARARVSAVIEAALAG